VSTERKPPDFSACWLKLRRAHKHFEAIAAQVKPIEEPDPRRLDVAFEQVEDSVREYSVHTLPPATWLTDDAPLIIGEFLHHARGVLDHAVYQVTRGPDSGFPACLSEVAFATEGMRMLPRITEPYLTIVKQAQPYYGGDDPVAAAAFNSIAILTSLSNRDKHRLIIPVGLYNAHRHWIGIPDVPGRKLETKWLYVGKGTTERRTEIMRFRMWPLFATDHVNVQPGFSFEVAMKGNLPLLPTLEAIGRQVEFNLRRFEAAAQYGTAPVMFSGPHVFF
jgi:hypothetical protein